MAVRQLIVRASRVALPVLVLGETGTGKELVAQSIHALSGRAGQFVAVNCGAIPDTLAESELFGHERGAFTGAHQRRAGRILAADRGTLFLDEVEDLSPALQAGLLRFLATGEIQRLGSDKTIRVDTRVIAASNQDLEMLVDVGQFRADLFYRLDVLRVAIAPLRMRRQDISPLARHFARQIAVEIGQPEFEIPSELLSRWTMLRWAGNVRELENHIRRCAALSDDPGTWHIHQRTYAFPDQQLCESSAVDAGDLDVLLERHEGNLAAVARALGVTRQAIWKRVRRVQVSQIRGLRSAEASSRRGVAARHQGRSARY